MEIKIPETWFDYSRRWGGGMRKVYEIDPPVAYGRGKSTRFVVADYADTFDRGPETMVFPSDEHGEVLDWCDLFVGCGNMVEDDSAVRAFMEQRFALEEGGRR